MVQNLFTVVVAVMAVVLFTSFIAAAAFQGARLSNRVARYFGWLGRHLAEAVHPTDFSPVLQEADQEISLPFNKADVAINKAALLNWTPGLQLRGSMRDELAACKRELQRLDQGVTTWEEAMALPLLRERVMLLNNFLSTTTHRPLDVVRRPAQKRTATIARAPRAPRRGEVKKVDGPFTIM